MKAKYNIGLISVLLIVASSLQAQMNDIDSYGYDGATVTVNNYYGDYDYFYSSRISRFHRSYTSFNYYAPVFTETYWYNYQPYTWGISIYGGGGFGYGFSTGYPVYGYNYGYNRGWYEPYFSNSFFWGYAPVYYNYWYAPAVVNVRPGYNWHAPYYYGSNGHGEHHNHYNDYYRPANTSYGYYPSGNKSNNSGNVSRRETATPGNNTSGSDTRRYLRPSKDRRVADDGNTGNNGNNTGNNNGNNSNNSNNSNNTNNGNNNNSVDNGNRSNNTNNGNNNNSVDNGNRSNNTNNGNNNNSRTSGNSRTISKSDKKISFPASRRSSGQPKKNSSSKSESTSSESSSSKSSSSGRR